MPLSRPYKADDADDEDADGGSPEMAEENFDRIGAAFQKKGKLEEVLLPIVFKDLKSTSRFHSAAQQACLTIFA